MTSRTAPGRRAQERRTQILDAAARQLNARGVSPASLGELAASLGLTRAALYGYVKDRRDLVFQCYLRSCELIGERLAAAADEQGDALDRIESFLGRVLDADLPEAAAIHELGLLVPDQRAEIERRVAEVTTGLAELLADGQRAGLIAPVDRQVVARCLLSLVYWLKLAPRWLSEEAALPRDRLLRAARRLLFEGLGVGITPLADAAIDLEHLGAGGASDSAASRREAILAGASQLFNRQGMESTSVDDVAAAVGVAKRTLYYHFPDKSALISACQLRAYAIFQGIGEQAAARPGSRAAAMAAGVQASVMASLRADLSPLRVASGLPGLDEPARQAAAAASAGLQAQYEAMFRRGLAEGSMRAADVRPTLMAVAGVSSWTANAAHDADGPPYPHVAQEIASLVINGMRTR